MKNFIILFVLSLLVTGLFGEITPVSVNEFNEEELKESNGEITILFAYTSQAACAAGGPAILKQNVDKGLRLLNEALTNSRIDYTVRAVPKFVEVDYENSVSSRDAVLGLLNELDKFTGVFNIVHHFRKKEKADMICLIFSGIGMGMAQLGGDKMVCHYSTFDESYVFPHEFGHNLGATHEAGKRFRLAGQDYRTVSNNGGEAIPYYSEDREIDYTIDDVVHSLQLGDAQHNNAQTMRDKANDMARRGENLRTVPLVGSAANARLVEPGSAPMPACTKEKVEIQQCFIGSDGVLTFNYISQDEVKISAKLLDSSNNITNVGFSTSLKPTASPFVSKQSSTPIVGDYYEVTIADETFECPIGKENATSKIIITIPGSSVDPNPDASVQYLLDKGESSPLDLYKNGVILDSLYGKEYQGGYIFYLDIIDEVPSINGLIAAKKDLGRNMFGYSNTAPNNSVGKVAHSNGIPNLATLKASELSQSSTLSSSKIGSGKHNSEIIARECDTEAGAKDCLDYSADGYDDWFLPSLEELYQLYLQRKTIKGLSIKKYDDRYWSSTQSLDSGNYLGWFIIFSNGEKSPKRTKNSWANIRPIRYF